MKVIYIAGPYRSDTVRGIIANIRNAEAVAIEVWKAGFCAICPHMNTALLDGVLPDKKWLDGDIEILHRCDCVVMVDGWERSAGARVEMSEAIRIGLPVFFSVSELSAWGNS